MLFWGGYTLNGSALYDFRTGEMIYETFLPDRVREDLQQMARAIPTIGFELLMKPEES